MQKITQNQLIDKAVALLADGTVTAVLGWHKGEFGYDVTPAMFKTEDDLKQNFVWNDFCGANFSKYLVTKAEKAAGKVLVFLHGKCGFTGIAEGNRGFLTNHGICGFIYVIGIDKTVLALFL